MTKAEYLAFLRRDGDAFIVAAERAGHAGVVRACPRWDVADLVWHMGEVHAFWCRVAEERLQDVSSFVEPQRPQPGELSEWYRSGLDHLIEVLAATDDDTAVWTWASQRDIGFIVRRMAQETAVHRWDAQDAAAEAGGTPPDGVEAALASDGIDEFCSYFLSRPDPAAGMVGGTVHIHCADVPGEWLVAEDADGQVVVTREHAKGSCALRGPASDLLLALWRRIPLDRIDIVGDTAVAERFVKRNSLG